MPSNTVKTLKELNREIDNSKFEDKERKILKEIFEIIEEMDDSARELDAPTDQLIELLEDFGGTENPLFMLIAFIYKHLDDYYTEDILESFFDFEE